MSLLLDAYYFTSITVDANGNFHPPESKRLDVDVQVGGELTFFDTEHATANFRFAVDSEKNLPYTIDICVFGTFRTDGEEMAELAKHGALDHALNTHKDSILGICYSATRELVLLLTARQPWGPFCIPTIYPSSIDIEFKLGDQVEALAKASQQVLDDRPPLLRTKRKAKRKAR